MKSVSFSIERVNRLRRAAEKIRKEKWEPHGMDELPFGVRNGKYRANRLLQVFDALWLKAGLAVRSLEFPDAPDGSSLICAVPADSPPLGEGEGPTIFDPEWQPSQLPVTYSIMEALEGDGSPWSYLSASILFREVLEHSVWWHGFRFGSDKIISEAPRQAGSPETRVDAPKAVDGMPVADWTWHAPSPREWRPTVNDHGATKEVVLHFFDSRGEGRIYRHTDTYRAGHYEGSTDETVLCSRPRGFAS